MKAEGASTQGIRHLWLAGAALLTALGALLAVHLGMARVIGRHTEAFDVYPFPEKLIGLALQRQAFADPGLLPVYGSSELTQPQANRADEFFEGHPTGFGTFLVGNPGETCLIIATKLAALGLETRGKKVVVFLSPGWFLEAELDHKGFGVNFSPLQGNVFAFQSRLSSVLRRDLSRRLLDYPETVGQSPLLDTSLRSFVETTPANQALRAALRPMGWAQTSLQKELEFVRLFDWWRQPHPARAEEAEKPTSARVDWSARLQRLEKQYARQKGVTAYSVGPRTRYDEARQSLFRDPKHPEATPDENFARDCEASKEWTDFRLLLRVAQEKGMRLLVVCQPLNTKFSRLQGLTPKSTTLFYNRLKTAVSPFKVRLVTFAQEETDAQFYQDSVHPSGKAWITYDAELDTFFHQPDAPTPN